MKIKTEQGEEIDVSDYIPQIKDNLSSDIDAPFAMTPIGTTANGGYFWWDEEMNPTLQKSSVEALLQTIKSESQ